DKTGVLTEGRPEPIGVDAEVLAKVAPLARASRHPLARAVAGAAGEGPVATDVVEHSGLGVEGRIDGRVARLGRAAFVGAPTLRQGETELWFGLEGETPTRLQFADRLRADAAGTVAALKMRGLTVEILSGDLAGPVGEAAEAAGIAAWRA